MVHGSPVAAVTRRPNSVMKSRPAFLVGLNDISPTVLKGYFLFFMDINTQRKQTNFGNFS